MQSALVRIAAGTDIPIDFGEVRHARKKTLVQIREPKGAETFATPWGTLTAQPDIDWVIVHAPGHEAPIKKDIFSSTYEPASQGYFRKRALVRLVQVPAGIVAQVATLEGELSVTNPDYIAIGARDEVYPNSAAWVAQHLEFVARPHGDGDDA